MSFDAIKANGQVTVCLTPPEVDGGTPSTFEVFRRHFATPSKKERRTRNIDDFLIVSYDSEYKTPDAPLTREEVQGGMAKYNVLSYQFHARGPGGKEWTGIVCPQQAGDRLKLGEFLAWVIASGVEQHPEMLVPTRIYLCGHFTRADVPAFADFKNLRTFLNSVRNTFLSIDSSMPIEFTCADAESPVKVHMMFRDSMVLAAQNARSLYELGKLVGVPKLQLHDDPAMHKQMIRNMDRVRAEHWPLFRSYAINDATVCLRYIERIMLKFEQLTGECKIPVTLTSIGVELLLKNWSDRVPKMDPLIVLGKEAVKEKKWNRDLKRYVVETRAVPIEEVFWYTDLVTATYHGGRNEQFWFGPAFEDRWTDFDLSSAYPTAMSRIGLPDWKKIRDETDIDAFTATTLGFACVDFEFPEDVRFPGLPVRTANGLVFPRRGRSCCAAPEIALARSLGAKVSVVKGVVVPADDSVRVFGDFIKGCLKERRDAVDGPKSLEGLFWKEISNSTYGKTAQGLRERRVYDMRNKQTEFLPESKITNPFFASYITSFTRAVLSEIMNALSSDVCVFSCTTDGFLCNASDEQIELAQHGELAMLFSRERSSLTGEPSKALEKKHEIRRPLGWRTRGQATLVEGNNPDVDPVLLAKGGIYTEDGLATLEERNEEIVRLFFSRIPETKISIVGKVGVREMVEYDADLVEKTFEKRLSMEYDWKRKPVGIGTSTEFQHIYFNTEAWDTVHEFERVREIWEEQRPPRCMKAVNDYRRFVEQVEAESLIGEAEGKYMRSPMQRLRQALCQAWRESEAGFEWDPKKMSAAQFAEILTKHGIGCSREDVHNAVKKKRFKPGTVPETPLVVRCLGSLMQDFPNLDIEPILFRDPSSVGICLPTDLTCDFMARVT